MDKEEYQRDEQLQQTANSSKGEKSKAELKAERRAKQEAQRAAKAGKQLSEGSGKAGAGRQASKGGGTANVSSTSKSSDCAGVGVGRHVTSEQSAQSVVKVVAKAGQQPEEGGEKGAGHHHHQQQVPERPPAQRQVALFQHLHQYDRDWPLTRGMKVSTGSSGIHPAIVKLGAQYAEGTVCGSNARCVALLHALKQVIQDYKTPPQKELSRDLEAKLKPCIGFLTACRPLSVSMGNAIKYLKTCINQTSRDISDDQAKSELVSQIESYETERICLAGKAISETFASSKIASHGDVIMVYACSSLIYRVLSDAHRSGKQFEVIVVDARMKMEGRTMLRKLQRQGIKCTYILITAISYMMQQVSKVVLGAHSVLANGHVMSRVGSAQLALVAHQHHVPVLVCCETYKFSERVLTDSFVLNELGDPDDVVSTPAHTPVPVLHDWRHLPHLTLLNLAYDVTPQHLITVVITELGCLPCTSVPVVLRVKST